MRMDAFVVSLSLLFFSLVALAVSNNIVFSDAAYLIALVSMMLFTIDDWIDLAFIRWAQAILSIHAPLIDTQEYPAHTYKAPLLIVTDKHQPRKARQKWLAVHSGRGIRHMVRHPRAA